MKTIEVKVSPTNLEGVVHLVKCSEPDADGIVNLRFQGIVPQRVMSRLFLRLRDGGNVVVQVSAAAAGWWGCSVRGPDVGSRR